MAKNKKQKQKTQRKKSKSIKNQRKHMDNMVVHTFNQLNKRLDKNTTIYETQKEAVGVAIHSIVDRRTPSGLLQEVSAYTDPNLDDRNLVVDLSRKLRSKEGICSSVADLLLDFSATRGRFETDNEDLKKLLNDWAAVVNSNIGGIKTKESITPVPGLRAVSRKIVDSFLTDGDAVFSWYWKNGVKLKLEDKDSWFLPASVKVLDSVGLSIDEDLAKLGVERITYEVDRDLKEKLLNPETDADKFLQKSIPKEWLSFLRKDEPIILSPEVTFHIKRNAKDYKPWGEPLFLKAFNAVADKRRLQAVDVATIDGLLNRITVFSLGLADKEKNPSYHVPSKRRVDALIALLTNPKRMNAIVWPGPDLKIDDIGPDGKILEFTDKYAQVDRDILRSLHVSPLLIDGGSSGQSMRDWAAFLSTEVGLDYIRDEIERVFTLIGRKIAEANGIEFEWLYYQFDTQLLKDEKRIRSMALRMFELGGISVETFVKTMGYNFRTERYLKEKEKAEGIDIIFSNPNAPGFTNVNQDEGRPPETIEDDVIDETAKVNERAVDLYFGLYLSWLDKLKTEISSHLSITPDDLSLAEMSLIGNFSVLARLVETEIKDIYKRNSGGRVTDDLNFVLNWNKSFLDNFYLQLRDELRQFPNSFVDNINRHEYRLFLYARESFIKAQLAGQITKARIIGVKVAKVICPEESSCDFAGKDEHFELDFLLENFPSHPNCNCVIEFIKET